MDRLYAHALVTAWKDDKPAWGELSLTAHVIGDHAAGTDELWKRVGIKGVPPNKLRARVLIAASWPYANDALWDGKYDLAVELLMKFRPQGTHRALSRAETNERRGLRFERNKTRFVKARELGATSNWSTVK